MSQLAHVQQRYEPDTAAAHMRTGSAPDMVDAPMDGRSGDAQHTSAFDRLSDLPPGAVTSILLLLDDTSFKHGPCIVQ